jgi:hypothetical protein
MSIGVLRHRRRHILNLPVAPGVDHNVGYRLNGGHGRLPNTLAYASLAGRQPPPAPSVIFCNLPEIGSQYSGKVQARTQRFGDNSREFQRQGQLSWATN